MTPAQLQVFQFIEAEIEAGRLAPSIREIAAKMGICLTAAYRRVNALVRDGHLVRTDARQRNIALPRNRRRCPKCGCHLTGAMR